jgi:hypothetical protein
MAKFAYVDNTCGDVSRMFHSAIMAAIANGGTLSEDLADLITLTRCPAGSAAEYRIDWK